MAVLAVNTVDRSGESITALLVAAAGGGDSFVNTGVEYIIVKNNTSGGGAVTLTITFVIQTTVDSQVVTNRTVTVATQIEKIIGPFPTGIYNDANSRVNLTYSAVTDISLAVFKNTTS